MWGGCYFVRGVELAKIVSMLVPALVFKRTRWGAIAEDQFLANCCEQSARTLPMRISCSHIRSLFSRAPIRLS